MMHRRSSPGTRTSESSETDMIPPATIKKGFKSVSTFSDKRVLLLIIALVVTVSFFCIVPYLDTSAGLPGSNSNTVGSISGLKDSNEYAIRSRNFKRSSSEECWSRSEIQIYGYLMPVNSSKVFREKLKAYSKHHGSCMASVKNWRNAFLGKEKVSYTSEKNEKIECKFLIHHGSSQGLGNRLQAMVASFAYGLLTNRVIVIMDWLASTLICPPFSKLGIYMDWTMVEFVTKNAVLHAEEFSLSEDLWKQKVKEVGNKRGKIKSGIVEIHFRNSVEVQNFFCETVQERIRAVKFFVLSSEQYFLPGLYLVPSFRKTLEELFPDLDPFLHLSRYLLSPSNVAWERITRMYALHFANADRKIGIQVRTFAKEDEFAHERIFDCLVNITHALPPPLANANWTDEVLEGKGSPEVKEMVQKVITDPNPEKVVVFVTSLHDHHASFLRDAYFDGVAVDGTMVNVHSYSGQMVEKHDLLLDQRAFTEIWLVAMSDSIFSSHFSTFGYVAAGISGKKPYLLNVIPRDGVTVAISYLDNGRPVCEESVSSDPCFHSAPKKRNCNKTGNKESKEIPAYLQPCQDAPFGYRIDPAKRSGQ